MGLPMEGLEDMNMPTVPSGQTSGGESVQAPVLDQLNLTDLTAEKDRLEVELKALGSVLDSNGVTMDTSLLTSDGFPRNDIDVAQIRTTRAGIIRLRNDWQDIMNRIEKRLHEVHASLREETVSSNGTGNENENENEMQTEITPSPSDDNVTEVIFAKVVRITIRSPAAEAGLLAGDGIRRFGDVNWLNHEKLRRVMETVQHNEGRPIAIKVSRKNEADGTTEELALSLTPKRWAGPGTVGCYLALA